jgi:predicted amidohydrolase YtcJ
MAEAQAALPGARVVDLPGRMVMPGLLDVHNHFVWAGRAELYELFVPPVFTLNQVLEAVRDAASKKAPGDWLVGGIWGLNLIGQLNAAARAQLDKAAGGRPVMLRDDSHHNRFVSSAALAAAGITGQTPNPPHGEIVRDSRTGEATGLLLEGASRTPNRLKPRENQQGGGEEDEEKNSPPPRLVCSSGALGVRRRRC